MHLKCVNDFSDSNRRWFTSRRLATWRRKSTTSGSSPSFVSPATLATLALSLSSIRRPSSVMSFVRKRRFACCRAASHEDNSEHCAFSSVFSSFMSWFLERSSAFSFFREICASLSSSTC